VTISVTTSSLLKKQQARRQRSLQTI